MALKVNWPPASWETTLFDLFGMLYTDLMQWKCNAIQTFILAMKTKLIVFKYHENFFNEDNIFATAV